MSQAEINTFNSQFTKYEGKRKGSEVRTLISEIIASNSDANHQNNGATIDTVIVGSTTMTRQGTGEQAIHTSVVENSKTYTVKCEYGANGRVNKITCT